MVTLKIENLSKHYDHVRVLDNFSITIESGEFMVLLGPSGCGKTTALRCIAGLTHATKGQILLDGQSITDLSPQERDIAMVFQNYALYPHMTVYDNIAFPLKMRKKPKYYIQEKVTEMAELLGLKDLLKRKPRELSGGQMQRVALGRALVREPKLFLMDEPLSNLDAKLRSYMRTEIKKLQKQVGITTLYITHDQLEAMSMADRITVMKSGTIQQIGKPIDIYTRPTNTFVAQFVGSPQINLLQGLIRDDVIYLFSNKLSIPLKQEMFRLKKITNFIVGIRPRDIHILKENNLNFDYKFQGEVSFIEMLGDELVIEVEVYSTKLVITTSNIFVGLSIGEKIELGINYSQILYFDDTGKSIQNS